MADQKRPVFPIEIITPLLIQLPPKVLMKLMHLSRSQKNLIGDPSPLRHNLKYSQQKVMDISCIWLRSYNPGTFKLIDDRSFRYLFRFKNAIFFGPLLFFLPHFFNLTCFLSWQGLRPKVTHNLHDLIYFLSFFLLLNQCLKIFNLVHELV